MKLKFFIFLILGAGLLACSGVYEISVTGEQVEVNDSISSNNEIDSIIAPYQTEMSSKMNSVIAFAKNDFTKGRPNGSLNNWATDAVYVQQVMDHEGMERPGPFICLLNVGGLRNPLSEGGITLGDLYKLMPFDNEIVWVELPWEVGDDIAAYMNASGGEPIAGACVEGDSLLFTGYSTPTETFWVITSDYLMNGGDKMTFFEKQVYSEYSGTLLRDALIEQAQMQDTLLYNDEQRIRL